MADKPLLEVKDLVIHYETDDGVVKALNGVNIHIGVGETLGLVGETGAGKTTLAKGIMRLIPNPPGKILGGEVIFEGQDLLKLSTNGMEAIRGRDISMIFQDPMTSLNPVLTVGEQIMEVIENHNTSLSRQEARKWAENMLERVGIPAERFGEYPHQFSGGMKQRVAIARALATNPKILLCDEATSALDPNTTKSILELLKKINREMGITVIVITHEMAVIEAICDRVAIIDHSHIAEVGNVSDIFSGPKSDIGRQLILGDVAEQNLSFGNSRQIRIIFDGRESSEPVIANMVLACKVPVNIMHADTRDIEGKAMGQMIIQLPEDDTDAGRICNYLKTANVKFEEVR